MPHRLSMLAKAYASAPERALNRPFIKPTGRASADNEMWACPRAALSAKTGGGPGTPGGKVTSDSAAELKSDALRFHAFPRPGKL